ncbi:MAG: hypothetical protein WAJ85_04195 [Candidatus Baltobacteraceae bacterium]
MGTVAVAATGKPPGAAWSRTGSDESEAEESAMRINSKQREAILDALEVAQKLEKDGPWIRAHGIASSESDSKALLNGLRAAAAIIEFEPLAE